MSIVTLGASLTAFNTLRINSQAERLSRVTNRLEIDQLLLENRRRKEQITVVGEGSNVVFRSWLSGTVLQIGLKGREVVSDDGRRVTVRVAAGENWHELVLWCHQHDFHGLANLALIPGSVGAAPIQNIGAYGVEVAEFVKEVHVVDRHTGEYACLDREDCQFGYRDSIFKHQDGSNWLIYSLDLCLDRQAEPVAEYPAVAERLRNAKLSHDAVLASVMSIRQSRLPDYLVEPNVGSFFKNPIIPAHAAANLIEKWPDAPCFRVSKDDVKVSAAWLIETLNWRGRELNGVRVSKNHALVLVGCGATSADPYLSLASAIIESVEVRFNIKLEIEPQVLGGDEQFVH